MSFLSVHFGLNGKTALVTGGSQGLGRTLALALAKAGADVAILARTESRIRDSVAAIKEVGRRSMGLPFDITEPDSAQAAVRQVVEAWGTVDILVNGAGIIDRTPATDVDPNEWRDVVNTNLNGCFWMSQAVAPWMMRSGSGKIINIGSVTSSIGLANRSSYTATKGAVVQLTRALAAEWGSFGICVNAIAPGFFRTELNDSLFRATEWRDKLLDRVAIRREGFPADLEAAIVFLAGPGSNYVTGHVLYVDGGYATTDTL